MYRTTDPTIWATWWWLILSGAGVFITAFCMTIVPVWGVWSSRKRGEAELAEANYAEQVEIAKANARLKSAEMNKQSEIVEASAVSESIKIIGESLAKNESYLRWQWVKKLDETQNKIIYVPTEANLPILEATRNTNNNA